MTDASTKRLKTAMFEALRMQLSGDGFVLRPSRDCFVRDRGGTTDMFQLVCLDGKPGWRIQPNVAVRVEQVEEIFHKTSKWDPKYQKDTPTIGGAIGNITTNDNRACEFFLESNAELSLVTERIVRVFREFALPYFMRFTSLAAIDAELNDCPFERTPHRAAPWLRCSTGIIVAKLVGRSNYRQIVDAYTDLMGHSDKGFYLKRFQALVDSLESVVV